jgi:sigma-B regulation protein RsbQ
MGQGRSPLLFAHGFGCDQNMWRFVAPAFQDSHRVILFDHVGAGQSDAAAYNRKEYAALDGYATQEGCGFYQVTQKNGAR